MSRFVAIVVSAAVAWIVACSSSDSSQPPATAQVAQAIQTADLVGSSATGFFPVGFFIDGHQIDQPNGSGMEDNYDAFPGGPPVDPNDALQYYDETFTQMRSLGMNSMLMPNVDVIAGLSDGHLKSIASEASKLGGIYPVPGSQAIQGLTTPTGKFDGDPHTCSSQQAGSADDAVKEILAATVESCVDQIGSDTGAFCNKFLCTHSSLYCCPSLQHCVHKASGDALAGFYTLDEPSEPCAPVLREVTKHLGLYDPGHSGFASISTYAQTYRGTTFDKMLGDDHVLYDDVWPLIPGVTVGDVLSLKPWANRIDDHYVLAPADKPLYYDIQAASDCCIRKPTQQEIRYLTYAALARGVKGIFFYLYGPQPPLPSQSGGPADTDYNLDATGQELRSLGQAVRTLAPYLIDATRDMPRKNGRSPIATAYRTDGGTGSGGSGYDLDVTSFTTEAGEHEVMLVNARLNPGQSGSGSGSADPASIPFQVTVDPGTSSALFAKGAVTVRDVLANMPVGTFSSGSIAFGTLPPGLKQGEGRLYLLQSDFSAAVTIARDAYHNPVAAPKPVKVQVQLKNTGVQNWTTTNTKLGIHVYAPDGTPSDILGLSVPSVSSGNATTLTVSIPTGAGTSITQSGTYQLGFDLYKVTGTVWFKNEKRISVMVVPSGQQPLLVDTFDRVPFGSSPDALRKWDRTGLMKIRGDALAVNGGNAAVSHWGSGWGDYTLDFDVMVDVEAQGVGAQAGWIVHATVPNPSSGTATSGYVFELQAQDPTAISTMNVSRVQSDGSLYPVASVPTKIPIGKGTWYHVTQVVSSTTVSTHIYPAGFVSQGQNLDNVTINAASGAVGFYELDPGYVQGSGSGSGSDYSCQSSPVGFCSGGSVAGTPCVANVNCLGGTCAGAVDNCYPSLQRGHFDNVFVYKPQSSFTISAPSGLVTTASTYPLTLSWNRVEPNDAGDAVISHYRVYRSADCNFTPPSTGTLVAEPAAAQFVDITPGTYCYKVTAVSFANAEGPASAGASGTVGALLSTPTVTATVSDTKSVAVAWTSIPSAVKYLVYRGAPGFVPSESTMIATVTVPGSTTYQDAPPNMYVSDTQLGLNSFTTYKYAVIPVAADGVVDTLHAGFSSSITPPSSKIFSDGFDGTAAKWSVNSGTWTVATSAYTQSDTACTANSGNCASTIMGASPLLWPTYGDLSIETTLQITVDAGGGYAGVTIRKTHSSDQYGRTGAQSGYLVYMMADGTLGIKSPTRPALLGAVVTTGLPMNVAHRLRVDASGQRLRVYVDGYKYIDYYDDTAEFLTGYVDLATYKSSVKFSDVNVFFREGFSEITLRDDFWSMDCATMLCDTYMLPGTSTLTKPGNWGPLATSPYSGEWWISSDSGTSYLHEDEYPAHSAISTITKFSPPRISDANISFDVQITDYYGDPQNWVGLSIRKQSTDDRFGGPTDSGYLIYYRANGQIQIFNVHDGVMVGSTYTAPVPTTERKVWVQAQGNSIKVFVGAPIDLEPPPTPVISVVDSHAYWSSGYIDLTTYGTAARFRELSISRFLPNWKVTSPTGTLDTRWPYQLMLPAPAGVGYAVSPTALKVADFTADFGVRIDAHTNSTGWAAFSFHKTNPTDSIFTSGYMVALNPSNGTLFLYGAPPAPAFPSCTIPTTGYQRIRVKMQGSTIQVWANGALCITATTSTWPSGYVDLTASEVTARYEYLEIY